MKRPDWHLLVAAPALLGLLVMGCSNGSGPKPAGASTIAKPLAIDKAQATTDMEPTESAATELADAGTEMVRLSVPGMH